MSIGDSFTTTDASHRKERLMMLDLPDVINGAAKSLNKLVSSVQHRMLNQRSVGVE